LYGALTNAPFAADSKNPLAIIALLCRLFRFFKSTTAPSPALFSTNTNKTNAMTERTRRPHTEKLDQGRR
jgi:hypothetical protein